MCAILLRLTAGLTATCRVIVLLYLMKRLPALTFLWARRNARPVIICPFFSGALPSCYMQMEAEVIGVPQYKDGRRVDPDPGMHSIQPLGFNRYAFKITTVRNAARTAPYMHNGVFQTLEEVIDFYDKGGAAGSGIRLTNQTLSSDKLHLTAKEKQQLVAFIKSLDSQ